MRIFKNKNNLFSFAVYTTLIVVVVLGFLFSWISSTEAQQTNTNLDVSAYLLNANNEAIPNGEYQVRFALYTKDRTATDPYPSETDSRVWEETRKIVIYNGLLKAYLGEQNPLPASIDFAQGQYFLGIRIDQDSEMVPRKRVGSVPLAKSALNSLTANSALSLNGVTTGTAPGNIVVLGSDGKIDSKLFSVKEQELEEIDTDDFVKVDDTRLHDQNSDTGTSSRTFVLGTDAELTENFDLTVAANIGMPTLRYNATTATWQLSNDGASFSDISTSVTASGSYLSLTGGTMTGDIVFTPTQRFNTSALSGIITLDQGGTGLTASDFTASDLLYYDSGNQLSTLPIGSHGQVLQSFNGSLMWRDAAAGSSHNLLSLAHPDTVSASPLSGDLVVGQPFGGGGLVRWQRFPVGNAGQILATTDGVNLSWNDTTIISELGTVTAGVWNAGVVADAYLADNLTITAGTISGSDLSLNQSAAPAPVMEGLVEWDTDDDRLVIGTGGGQAIFYPGLGAGGIAGTGNAGEIAYWQDATTLAGEANLAVTRGGTGVGSFTQNGVLYGNLTGDIRATTAGTEAQILIANATGVPTFVSLGGDITVNSAGVATIGADAITLGTDTVGGYIRSLSNGNGLTVSGGGLESVDASLNLGPLTADWNQTGAFDLVLANGASELRIMEETGASFYGTFNVADLTADRSYTFPDQTGTVLLDTHLQLHDTVTLVGQDYLSLTDQQLTAGQINLASHITGVLPVANGGTGVISLPANSLLLGNGAANINSLATGSDGQLLLANAGVPTFTSITGAISLTSTGVTSLQTDSVGSAEIVDSSVAEADLDITNAPTDNYILKYTGGALTWAEETGGTGGSKWTDDGAFTYLTHQTDDLMIGGNAADAASFFFDTSDSSISFEGATADLFETTLELTDPTADRTIILPDQSGTVALDSQLHNAVTLIGQSYLTLTDQQLSAGQINLASHVTGTLPVANGGTGAASFNTNGVLYGNGTSAVASTNSAASGQLLVANASGIPAFVPLSGDLAVSPTGVATINSDSVALGTDTTGNYVQALTNGSGIAGADGGSEAAELTLSLGTLTEDWNQTGAFDLVLANAGSELRIMEDTGATFYGTIDVGDLTADRSYSFPDQSGVVALTSDIPSAVTLSGAYDYLTLVGQDIVRGQLNLTTDVTGALPATNGGTGRATLTSNGVLYGNGTGAVGVTTAGTAGQLLVANASGVPTFVSLSGDLNIDNAGVATIQADTVGTDEILDSSVAEPDLNIANAPTENYILKYVGANLTWAPESGGSGASKWTDMGTYTYLTHTADDLLIGGSVVDQASFFFNSAESTITFEGITANAFETTLEMDDPTADRRIVFSDQSGTVVLDTDPQLHSAVTLVGQDYLSLTDQQLTAGQINLASHVTGTLSVANGGTGTASFPANRLLLGNGSGAIQALAAGTSGQLLITNATGIPTFISMSGDITIDSTGVTTIGSDAVALGTDTTGNYVQALINGSGIAGADGGSEAAELTLSLGTLTEDWNQTGAFDLVLANAGSELRIMEDTGATFYGTIDVGDLTADRNYSFPDQSGTVALSSELHSAVSLSGAYDYLTLVGQDIVRGQLDLATDVTGALPVANGGTGRATLTSNGVLYGNGAGAIGATAAGTGGQALIANSFGVPVFVSVTGDLNLDASGVATIQADAVGTSEIADGSIVEIDLNASNVPVNGQILKYDGVSGGFTWATETGGSGSSKWTDAGSFTYLTSLASDLVLGSSGVTNAPFFFEIDDLAESNTQSITFEGSVDDDHETKFVITNPTADRRIVFPDSSGTVVFSGGSGSSKWTDAGAITYLSETTDDLVVGGSTLDAPLSVDVSANTVRVGTGTVSNAVLNMYAADGDTGSITYTTADGWAFENGNLGIGDASPLALLTVGAGDLFQVNSSGAVAAATGITSSGTITFSGLSTGLVHANAAGTLSASAVDLASADITGILPVDHGGTGAISFTQNGILYGDGASAVQVTAAGTAGQLLVANATGVPTFVSLSGDLNIDNTGVATIQADTIGTSEVADDSILEVDLDVTNAPTDGYILKYDQASGGFSWAAETGGSGSSKWTDNGTFTYLTATTDDLLIGGTATDTASFFFDVSDSSISFEGATADLFETTLELTDPTADRTITLPDQSGTVALSSELHSSVTLSGAYDYLTLAGQDIVRGQIDLATDVTGALPVANGGTGRATLTSNGVLYGNGLGAAGVTTAGTAGQLLVANATGVPTFVTMSGDISITDFGVATISSDAVALGTDTTGSYVQALTNGSGIAGADGGSEAADLTLSLGNLTEDWNQAGAFDLVLANAGSELKIMEAAGSTFYGALDVIDLTADRSYSFPDQSGTVALTSDIPSSVTLSGAYDYLTLSGQDIFRGQIDLTTDITGTLPVANGGTGTTSLTANRLLLGNGAGAIGVLAAGTVGQFLVSGGAGVPTFISISGDLSIDNTGVATIQADTIGTSEIADDSILEVDLDITNAPTDGYILKYDQASGGFSWAQETGGSGSSKWTDSGTFTYLTQTTDDVLFGGSTSETASFFFDVSDSSISFEGATADLFETTLELTDPTADRTIVLPDQSGTVILNTNPQLHDAVTLTGQNYLSLTGQQLAASQIDLSSHVTGTLPVASGGTGTTSLTANRLLLGNGANAIGVLAAGTAGQFLVSGGVGVPTFVSFSGDLAVSPTGVATISSDAVALGTDTTGNYVQALTNGSGIAGANGGSEAAELTLSLGALTEDWNQTGAFDLVLANAGSELKIMEDTGATFYGTIDVGDLSADRNYNFPDQSGVVALTSDIPSAVTLSGAYDYLTLVGQDIVRGQLNLTTDVTGALPAANGGTGRATLTSNGVLYGNGTGAVGVTTAGTAGQLLVANASGVPTFVSLSGDLNIDNAGVATIQANAVGSSEITDGSIAEVDLDVTNAPTDGYILKYDQASGGFSWAQETGGSGSSKWTDNGTFTYLTATTDDLLIGGTATDTASFFFDVSDSSISFEGATADLFETTLEIADPTADRTIVVPDSSGTLALIGDIHAPVTLAGQNYLLLSGQQLTASQIDLAAHVSGILPASNGGTGLDTSAASGVATVTGGTWSIASALAVGYGGTGVSTEAELENKLEAYIFDNDIETISGAWTVIDNVGLKFGTTVGVTAEYNTVSSRLEFSDGANVLAALSDGGTVGNLFISGGVSTYNNTVTDGYGEFAGLCLGDGTNCITNWGSVSGLSGTGSAGRVAYWDGANSLTGEDQLAPSRGGTGLDTASLSGIPTISSGTWSTSPYLGLGFGGTGGTLADPNADRIMVWDDSAGITTWLAFDSSLAIDATPTLSVDVTTTGVTATTQSNSGLETGADGMRLLGGCEQDQILTWDLAGQVWRCSFNTGGTSNWTDSGTITYLTSTTRDFAIGGTTLANSMFSVDESAGVFGFGLDNSANPRFDFEATDGDAGSFGFNTGDAFYFSDAKVGIGTTSPGSNLSVAGDLQISSTTPSSDSVEQTTTDDFSLGTHSDTATTTGGVTLGADSANVGANTYDTTTTADSAREVYTADLDADGDLDVLSASVVDDTIAWYENDGTESFITHVITNTADGASSVYAADVDSDGDIDVLSASMSDSTIAWYENDGMENFTDHVITNTANVAYNVYAADLDADGDLDVLSASYGDDTIAWYENDGVENFTTHIISNTADGASSVYAVDLDADGDLDVLSASANDDTIAWYENDGSENFTTHVITNTADGARDVYAADLDSDGDLDVFSASQIDDTIAWYENDGAENFTKHVITNTADGAHGVYVDDLDSDSDLDVLSASYGDDTIAWYENDGVENFTTHNINTTADGAYNVYAADLDSDGDLDVLSASANDDTIAWYETVSTYNASGTFISSAIDTHKTAPNYTSFDFDVTEPANTDVQFQLRSAATEAALSSATWYGPTGTGDYYTTSGTATNGNLDSNRYIQVRAVLSTSDNTVTPTLNDFTVNYEYDNPGFLVDSSGRVGIGTATPDSNSLLTIGSDSNANFRVNSIGQVTSGTWMGDAIVTTSGGTGTTTQFTEGSLAFAGANGIYSQDNSNLFWDDTNNRLGIGTATPSHALHVLGDVKFASGSGAQSVYIDAAAGSDANLIFANNAATLAKLYFDQSNSALTLTDGSNTDTLYLAGGKVGVGTSSPAEKLTVIGNIRMERVSAPGATTATVNAVAGNLNGSYRYRITYLTATGETEASAISAAISPVNQQANVTLPVAADPSVTGRRVYRTLANAAAPFATQLVATINNNTDVNYVDNIADGALGIAQPTINTTGAKIFANTGQIMLADSQTTGLGVGVGVDSTGLNQTLVGRSAGYANTGGNLLALGYMSGYQNSGNNGVFIGYQAGYQNALANQFILRQASVNSTPLLQGDFASGRLGIGLTTPTAVLDLSAATVSQASLRVRSGVAPTAPNEGEIYSDGTDLLFYDGSAWVDLTSQGTTTFLGLTDTMNSYTAGSLLFTSGSGVTEDSSNLFWDDTNNRLGLGTTTPASTLSIAGDLKISSTAPSADSLSQTTTDDFTAGTHSDTATTTGGVTLGADSANVGANTYNIATTADGAREVYVTDLDSDGDLDVLSASMNDDTIAWYENNGTESFTTHVITNTADGAYGVYAADLDSDGDIDVLSASLSDNTIAWYENDGTESFTTHVITNAAGSAYDVHAADLDADGDLDLVAAVYTNGNAILWYENDGNENFTVNIVSSVARYGYSVYLADSDVDGDIDIFSAYNNTIAWHENDGTQNFTTHIITSAANGAYDVHAADLDSDGDIDALSVAKTNDTVAWYENDGAENFTTHNITTTADGAQTVYASDLDSDGDIDVLSASTNDDTVAWYENDGAENFTTHVITSTADGAYGVYTADLDSDGDLDVLSASYADDTIAWYETVSAYKASGSFISSAIDTHKTAPDYTSFDFNTTEPANTDMQFQLRSAASEAALSSATWYGPTGTGDYFTTSGTATNGNLDSNRYIQVRAVLFTSDNTVTPTLNDFTVNYQYDNPGFLVDSSGRVGIGTATPDSNSLLTIGSDSNANFRVNSTGQVTSGTWMGDAIVTTSGGTGTTTQFTEGSLVFAGANGIYSQDNSNLFWDDTNNRLGLGTATPSAALDLSAATASQASLRVRTGVAPTTPNEGELYSDGSDLLFYDGSAWVDLTSQGTTTFLGLTDTMNSYTAGSLLFTSGSGVTEDSSNLFWDDTNNRLGLGTATPTAALDLSAATASQASLRVRTGVAPTTPNEGELYSDGTDLLFYDGSAWVDLTSQGTTTFLGLTDTMGAYTAGSLLFTSGSGVTEDNSNLFWDDTNNRLGIGDTTPAALLTVGANDAFQVNNSGAVTATSYNGLALASAADGFTIAGGTTSRTLTITGGNVSLNQDLLTSSSPTFSSLTLTNALTVANGGTGTQTQFTPGSVVFATTDGVYSQDNSNFFWDDANNRLGLGTVTPASTLSIAGDIRVSPTTSSNDVLEQTSSEDFSAGTHSNTKTATDEIVLELSSVTVGASTHNIDTVADGARDVYATDLDSDGDLDVLTALAIADDIVWYENNGAGSFTKRNIDSDLDGADNVYAADLDSDGDLDVMATSYLRDTIIWYENNGSESFTEHILSSTADGVNDIDVADLDSDGDLDILVAITNADSIAWYENDGTGNFTARVAVNGVDVDSVDAADLDADGDLDIVAILQFDDNSVVWYENNGAESFTAHNIAAGGSGDIYAVDLDVDGDIDIVSAYSNSIVWHENNGTANFTTHTVSTSTLSVKNVHTADLDSDGDLDIVSASSGDDTIAWHENDGSENFTKHNITIAADEAYGVYTADLDSDGDVDVLSVANYGDTVAWYETDSVYNAAGAFISSAIDSNRSEPNYTSFDFNISEPTNTDLQFQLRSAATKTALAGATWYGPTGTGDYYTVSGTATNSAIDAKRYIQVKAVFSTANTAVTPVLHDFAINSEFSNPGFLVDSSGRVGVGTSSPDALLTVGTDDATGFRVDSTGRVVSGTWMGDAVGVLYGGTGTTTQFTEGSLVFAGANGSYSQDNSNLFWDDANNRLGIGDTTPAALLTVGVNDAFQVNNSGAVTATSYNGLEMTAAADGFTIAGGTTSRTLTITGGNVSLNQDLLTSSSPTFASLTLTNALTVANGGTGTQTQFTPGSVVFATTDGIYSQDNSNFFWDDTNNRLGLGTATPSYVLDVAGASGVSELFRVSADGTEVVTVTEVQTTFNNPVNFANVGDVSMAHDLVMSNTTAASLKFEGAGYLTTESAWQNLDLTLAAANAGNVVVDDTLQMVGDIVPDTNDSYQLGASTTRFQNAYLSGSLNLGTDGNAALLAYDTSNNYLTVDPDGDATAEFIFADGGQLGVGTAATDALLNVMGTTEQLRLAYDTSHYAAFNVDAAGNLQLQASSGTTRLNMAATQNYLQVYDSTGADYLQLTHNGTNAQITTNTGAIELGSSGDFVVDTGVNVGIGGVTSFGTGANNVLAIASSTAPTTSVVDGIQLFAVEEAGSHELRVRDEAGNITTLSPHNFSLIPEETRESLAWSYYSEYGNSAINVDMTKAIRLLEQLSGQKLIYKLDLLTGAQIEDGPIQQALVTIEQKGDLGLEGLELKALGEISDLADLGTQVNENIAIIGSRFERIEELVANLGNGETGSLLEGVLSQLSAQNNLLESRLSLVEQSLSSFASKDQLQQLTVTTEDLNKTTTSLAAQLDTQLEMIDALTQKVALIEEKDGTELTEETWHTFAEEEDGEVITDLVELELADGLASGLYRGQSEEREFVVQKVEGADLSGYKIKEGKLNFEVFISDADLIEGFVTEFGSGAANSKLQWLKEAHPFFIDGWNKVSLPLSEGATAEDIDWTDIDFFRVQLRFSGEVELRFKDISFKAPTLNRLAQIEMESSVLDQELNLLLDGDQGQAITIIANTMEDLQTQLTAEADNTRLRLSGVETALDELSAFDQLVTDQLTLHEQRITALEAAVGMGALINSDKFAIDAKGDVVFTGTVAAEKLEAEVMVAGEYTVTNDKEEGESKNTGSTIIYKDQLEVFVENSKVKNSSRIIVTPIGNSPIDWIVSDKRDGEGFVIRLEKEAEFDVAFDYWIVQTETE